MQIETTKSSLQLCGQKSVTLEIHATPPTSALPPEKRPKVISHINGEETTGYVAYYYSSCYS